MKMKPTKAELNDRKEYISNDMYQLYFIGTIMYLFYYFTDNELVYLLQFTCNMVLAFLLKHMKQTVSKRQ